MRDADLLSPTASRAMPRRDCASEGGMVMSTRMIVFVIGIVTAVLGCATRQVQDDQSLHGRVASYRSPASSWYGAITVNPEQVFEN
jgi:hypothetical protein